MTDQQNSEIIYGRNVVLEALKAGTPINRILYCGERKGSLSLLIARAKEAKIIVTEVSKQKLTELSGTDNHQGVAAYVSPQPYSTVEEILQKALERQEPPFVIVLDEIQDPHNLGAIIRTADAVGAHGVIIPKRRSVQLTGVVSKASAGAISYVPVARVTNIPVVLKELKEAGLWIYGTDLSGETPFYATDMKGPLALVIGSEGSGMGRLTKQQCDFILSIPMDGQVSSLNASVAAGVVLYEIFKQRKQLK